MRESVPLSTTEKFERACLIFIKCKFPGSLCRGFKSNHLKYSTFFAPDLAFLNQCNNMWRLLFMIRPFPGESSSVFVLMEVCPLCFIFIMNLYASNLCLAIDLELLLHD